MREIQEKKNHNILETMDDFGNKIKEKAITRKWQLGCVQRKSSRRTESPFQVRDDKLKARVLYQPQFHDY